VKQKGPNGREFWHHVSLGPPPWRTQGYLPERNLSIHALVGGTDEDSMLSLPSRDQPMVRAGSRVMKLELDTRTAAVQETPYGCLRHSPMAKTRPEAMAQGFEPNPEPPPGQLPGGQVRRMSYAQVNDPQGISHAQAVIASQGTIPVRAQSSSSGNQPHLVSVPYAAAAGNAVGGSFITHQSGTFSPQVSDKGPFIAVPAAHVQSAPASLPARPTFAQGEIFPKQRAGTSSAILHQGHPGQPNSEASPRAVQGTGLMSVLSRR